MPGPRRAMTHTLLMRLSQPWFAARRERSRSETAPPASRSRSTGCSSRPKPWEAPRHQRSRAQSLLPLLRSKNTYVLFPLEALDTQAPAVNERSRSPASAVEEQFPALPAPSPGVVPGSCGRRAELAPPAAAKSTCVLFRSKPWAAPRQKRSKNGRRSSRAAVEEHLRALPARSPGQLPGSGGRRTNFVPPALRSKSIHVLSRPSPGQPPGSGGRRTNFVPPALAVEEHIRARPALSPGLHPGTGGRRATLAPPAAAVEGHSSCSSRSKPWAAPRHMRSKSVIAPPAAAKSTCVLFRSKPWAAPRRGRSKN